MLETKNKYYHKARSAISNNAQYSIAAINEFASYTVAKTSAIIKNTSEVLLNKEIVDALTSIQSKFELKAEKWRIRRQCLKNSNDNSKEEYANEEAPDVKLISDTIRYFNSRYHGNASRYFEKLSPEERVIELRTVAVYLAAQSEIHLAKVDFFFPNISNGHIGGYFDRDTHTFYINIAKICSRNGRTVTDVILTIAHEIYHARQFNAVLGVCDYGYSSKRIFEWGENFNNYFSVEYGPLYFYQPVELSAYKYEYSISKALR